VPDRWLPRDVPADVRLAEAYARMRALTHRLEHARESERRRLAATLREGLMQSLTAVSLGLERLKGALGPAPGAEAHALIESLQAELRRATQLGRDVLFQFHPDGLDHLGLWPVLVHQGRAWSETHAITLEFALEYQPALEADVALTGCRAVQEALANVARHAAATRVVVSSRKAGRSVEIRVEDDGHGIAPGDLEKPESLGLLGLRERALRLGGELRAERRRPRGTRVAVKLPCARRVP
jgi:signal transduction histidine kinase